MSFLRSYKGNKTVPNLTAAVAHGISNTVGKKPSKQKRKSPGSCVQSPEIEVVVDPLVTSASTDVFNNSGQVSSSNVAVTVSCGNGQQLISSTCSQSLQLTVNPSPTSIVAAPVQMVSTKHTQSTVGSTGPFQLKFLTPLIKICAGCRGSYSRSPDGKSLPPPLVRKEQHLYFNNVSGQQQLSTPSNVHYHATLSCPRQRCPTFDPNLIKQMM